MRGNQKEQRWSQSELESAGTTSDGGWWYFSERCDGTRSSWLCRAFCTRQVQVTWELPGFWWCFHGMFAGRNVGKAFFLWAQPIRWPLSYDQPETSDWGMSWLELVFIFCVQWWGSSFTSKVEKSSILKNLELQKSSPEFTYHHRCSILSRLKGVQMQIPATNWSCVSGCRCPQKTADPISRKDHFGSTSVHYVIERVCSTSWGRLYQGSGTNNENWNCLRIYTQRTIQSIRKVDEGEEEEPLRWCIDATRIVIRRS